MIERACGGCERGAPFNGTWNSNQCKECWLFHNDPTYAAAYGNTNYSGPMLIWYSGMPTGAAPIPLTEFQPAPAQTLKPIEEGPGWFRKLANFGQAAVKHVWNGLPETPTEIQESRIKICLNCPANLLDVITGQCNHKSCGCKIAIKTSWKDQACPLGYWGKEDQQQMASGK